MKAQHYSVKCPDTERVRPGCLVYASDDDDVIIGFIYRVDGDVIEVVLFKPYTLLPTVKPIQVFLMPNPDAWIDYLYEMLDDAPEDVQMVWNEILSYADL